MTMLSKYMPAAMLASSLVAPPRLAQTPKPAVTAQSASSAGLWHGSKLIGTNVYNDQNEKIGSIKELMIDKTGNIDSAVIGVRGFFGVGERDVAVKFSDLKWSNEPIRSSGGTTGAGTSNTPPTGLSSTSSA